MLHDINQRKAEVINESRSLYNSTAETLYLDQLRCGGKVFLNVVKVTLQQKALDTFAILDDDSEHTILLATAAHHLGLKGKPEQLNLRTVHQEGHYMAHLCHSVYSLQVTPEGNLPFRGPLPQSSLD